MDEEEVDSVTTSSPKAEKISKEDQKNHKKQVKLLNKAKRAGEVDIGSKQCDICQNMRDVLVRCTIDETCQYKMVCTRGCWQKISGNTIDGSEDKEDYYRYGGMSANVNLRL